MDRADLRKSFLELKTQQDVADLLGIKLYKLIHLAFKLPDTEKYQTFTIPKKSGGVRSIAAPSKSLLAVQQRINEVLQATYEPKPAVKGFVQGRSIVDNARAHSGRRWVFNLDLKNFFPTIHFGRVRGLFKAIPYSLPQEVVTLLAKLCCYNGYLPQGAPTSPVISNMLCSRLDSELRKLAKNSRAYYTRYADDITFSTSLPHFPSNIAFFDTHDDIQVGDELASIIDKNGFFINESKVRMHFRTSRQEITGLTANVFPNVQRRHVRQVRAMLYAWDKFGIDAATREHREKYSSKYRRPGSPDPSFESIVEGKIEFIKMVRGNKNPVYLKYRKWFLKLAPDRIREEDKNPKSYRKTTIATEGKTDIKHLKAALRRFRKLGLYTDVEFDFHENQGDTGSSDLLPFCIHQAKRPQPNPLICVFDRDESVILKKVTTDDQSYKDWGNDVFSLAIPVPPHRTHEPQISIEMLYRDEEIKTTDTSGRRLYLSSEFDINSSRHKEISDINIKKPLKKNQSKKVIDEAVFNGESMSIALPKNQFAEYILNQEEGFNNFKLDGFEMLFDIFETISTS